MSAEEPSRPAELTPPAPAAQAPEESLREAFGGGAGLLDAGLPGIVFVIAYTASGRDMQLSLILALVTGVALAVVRLIRRERLQHAVAGLIGVAIAAYVASRTGEARNFFLPGLFINAAYAAAYAISAVVRWPLIGLIVASVQQQGMGWRQDPVLMRAYTRATWLWAGMFLLRLAVQLPLYLIGDSALVALGIVRVVMGWPVFLITAYLTYVIVRSTGSHWRAPVTTDSAPGADLADQSATEDDRAP